MAEKTGGLEALTTLARFAAPRLLKHLAGGHAQAPLEPLRAQMAGVPLDELDAVAAAHAARDVEGTATKWTDTGLRIEAGEEVTLLAQGRLAMSGPLDIWVGPRMGLWGRIGDGKVFKVPAEASTLRAETSGNLRLIARPPGEWASPEGRFLPGHEDPSASGTIDVMAIKWRRSAEEGLARLVACGLKGSLGSLLAAAEDRIRHGVETPEGWHYLWRLGDGELYDKGKPEEEACIHCRTAADVGILQIPAERHLTDSLKLEWEWIAHELPSALPEHIQPTHDYLSIAVEFDNGLDLTYMWSAALPEDTIFQCPLEWWDERETHWVVRTKKDLGRWLPEARSIKADYERAIGGKVPEKVVQVWLIANSVFQRRPGRCDYRAIRLVDGGDRMDLC